MYLSVQVVEIIDKRVFKHDENDIFKLIRDKF